MSIIVFTIIGISILIWIINKIRKNGIDNPKDYKSLEKYLSDIEKESKKK